jgi:hypothetical protein
MPVLPPAKFASNGIFVGLKKLSSRPPIKNLRPLRYNNHPPFNLISMFRIKIGIREDPHWTFFAIGLKPAPWQKNGVLAGL